MNSLVIRRRLSIVKSHLNKKNLKVEQMLRVLFVGLLAGFWQPLEVAQCQNLPTYKNLSHCYNTSSGKTCFTTFLANDSHPVKRTFIEASDWCKVHVAGSSLIVIDSLENKRIVERFIGREVLANEIIFMDARKLSEVENVYWSWVNGHPSIPTDVKNRATKFQDAACVGSDSEQQLVFCAGYDSELLHYICEYSESISALSYQHNKSYYFASEGKATWYDARNECLRFEGDLSSITDINVIGNWSRLKESKNKRYWIGLHRNKWIWNTTGSAITYTNWEGGYPDESSDKQCICINPKCNSEANGPICENDRKWWTCNCENKHAIVCQRDATTISFHIPEVFDRTTVTQEPSNNLSGHQTTDIATPSTGLVNSFRATGILVSLLLLVVVILIIVAVILIIRKRKYSGRSEESPLTVTDRNEVVSSEYETMVRDKRPPAGDSAPIYTELELTQRPSPSNNDIYVNVQPTMESVDMDINIDYVDPREV